LSLESFTSFHPLELARRAALTGDEETAAEWLFRLPFMKRHVSRRLLRLWRHQRASAAVVSRSMTARWFPQESTAPAIW